MNNTPKNEPQGDKNAVVMPRAFVELERDVMSEASRQIAGENARDLLSRLAEFAPITPEGQRLISYTTIERLSQTLLLGAFMTTVPDDVPDDQRGIMVLQERKIDDPEFITEFIHSVTRDRAREDGLLAELRLPLNSAAASANAFEYLEPRSDDLLPPGVQKHFEAVRDRLYNRLRDDVDGVERILDQRLAGGDYLEGRSNREWLEHARRIAMSRHGFLICFSPEVLDQFKLVQDQGGYQATYFVTASKGIGLSFLDSITPLGPEERRFIEALKKHTV